MRVSTIRNSPLNVPLRARDGQYAGMVIVVTEHVMPKPGAGWTSTGHGYALGTVTLSNGATYSASFPLDVTVTNGYRVSLVKSYVPFPATVTER